MEYRVENKYYVSDLDIAILSKRLHPIMQQDVHQQDGCYSIRSVYFDDWWDTCLDENEAGIDLRKKYRIRTYAPENAVLKLEIKEKRSGLTKKNSCALTREEYEHIFCGGYGLEFGNRQPLNQLLLQMRIHRMQPKAIIAYERTAFVHPSGNVRITFDRNIMASRNCDSFFDEHISGLTPVLPTGIHILEVKYDEILPDLIAQQLEIGRLQQSAFSKYYLGRCAINGVFPNLHE